MLCHALPVLGAKHALIQRLPQLGQVHQALFKGRVVQRYVIVPVPILRLVRVGIVKAGPAEQLAVARQGRPDQAGVHVERRSHIQSGRRADPSTMRAIPALTDPDAHAPCAEILQVGQIRREGVLALAPPAVVRAPCHLPLFGRHLRIDQVGLYQVIVKIDPQAQAADAGAHGRRYAKVNVRCRSALGQRHLQFALQDRPVLTVQAQHERLAQADQVAHQARVQRRLLAHDVGPI